ncbi:MULTISPECIES: hypothetical protein [unclassified Brucella]|uniref:hypothetical protein n=1 Tax=unclassified Brucella TaxID=2632610 RepID=UPI00132789D8|nr:hypothetical protein [Brucella sp. 191011898]MRN44666.1 hypothetical protein [Brucella sp. 09RB8913]MRN57426.1 hypothetical protein [Brucella sp. 09RB8918]
MCLVAFRARFDLIESDRNAEHAGRKGLKQQKRQDWRPTLSLLYFKFIPDFKFNPGDPSKSRAINCYRPKTAL